MYNATTNNFRLVDVGKPEMRSKMVLWIILAVVLVLLVVGPRTGMITRRGVSVRKAPGHEEATALLQRLQRKLKAFLAAAPPEDPRIQRIKASWSGTISEIDKESEREGSLAYSLNKDTIYICLRAPDGSLADDNSAMFVLLHELAHVASVSLHHTPEFWENMKYLLELADSLGFYEYVDHSEGTATLCGRVLGPSPLTCVREKTCESTLPQTKQPK